MSECHWLLDASVLTAPELNVLHTSGKGHAFYAKLKDERAASMGPWLLPSNCLEINELVTEIKCDDERRWAVSELHAAVDRTTLIQHLSHMAYLWTAEGKRYFLRFADGRCMRALWPALTVIQCQRILAPLKAWRTTGRDGAAVDLPVATQAMLRPDAVISTLRLTLDDQQIGILLDCSWPDQLLSAVLEESPALSGGRSASQLYAVAEKTCVCLKQRGEERYSEQKAALVRMLKEDHGEGLPHDAGRLH